MPSSRFDEDVTKRLREVLAGAHALEELVLHTTCAPPPRLAIVPFRREALAMLGIRGSPESIATIDSALRPLGTIERHLVTQSTPRARERAWALGEQTPGVCLITSFRKKRDLDHAAFVREWYEHHTPLALETHPLAGYVRNAVEETHGAPAPAWHGIVLESFASHEDLLHPLRFFGGGASALRGMWRVASHVPRFLDLRTLENHLVRERVLLERT
ncbi:MAG: EthD domain-containing protein [Deltaproteobacteria bacterium]|nr:EthD domain-containing protein [Deltaproteobacteria bacterium]